MGTTKTSNNLEDYKICYIENDKIIKHDQGTLTGDNLKKLGLAKHWDSLSINKDNNYNRQKYFNKF